MTPLRPAKLNPVLYNLSKIREPEVKRSNHPDFATTSELQASKFSGVRHNSITEDVEFWIHGEIKRRVSTATLVLDPQAITKAYIELFGIHK